ncbi:MAG: helix-turn-helix domain-containing protein [Ruminococcaceae bacterium]|nr:helix-turn-helix domain-containing protein [Oscillospiraceae bacterium]
MFTFFCFCSPDSSSVSVLYDEYSEQSSELEEFGEHLCFAQKFGVLFVFYEVYSNLCKDKGISLSKAAEQIGLSRTSVVKWKAGTTPSGATLNKIAIYFGVSVDYLLDNQQKEKPATQKSDEPEMSFDDFTYAMHNESKELTDDDKQLLLDMARTLKQRRKNHNDER